MCLRWRYLLTLLFLSLFVSASRAQEGPGGAADPNAAPPPGVDKFYFDLTKSQDRAIKSMADRYLTLVKVQEWSDLSGKFKTVAHYVRHDPNLASVTIELVKGRGTDRTTEQKTVAVDKLSKVCQARVKQIDTMQKKLQQMAKGKPGENGAPAGPGISPEAPGGPRPDAPGAARGPEAGPVAPGAAPVAASEPDPSASDPDPLGFAELASSLGGPGSPGAPVPPPGSPGVPPGDPALERH